MSGGALFYGLLTYICVLLEQNTASNQQRYEIKIVSLHGIELSDVFFLGMLL